MKRLSYTIELSPYLMQTFKKYNVKAGDAFRAEDFPKAIKELDALSQFIAGLPVAYKKEIILSYLKKQSFENDWIAGNPDLTMLVSSGVFNTDHLESLFDSCQQNNQFRQEYEDYICAAIA